MAQWEKQRELNTDIKGTIALGEAIFVCLRRYSYTLLGTMVCPVLFLEYSDLIVLPDCTNGNFV